jgi:hypothetical protein
MLLSAFGAMGGVIATLVSWFRFYGINGVAACTERSEVSHTSGFCFYSLFFSNFSKIQLGALLLAL